uniref:Uncharacterized protein n=1 Tax=Oryza sativa subsp. japonica TaxID=39947 RepID=Q69NF2_ORYSJ|nr:hypothetical protein [Oryza sativa Japonica Group]
MYHYVFLAAVALFAVVGYGVKNSRRRFRFSATCISWARSGTARCTSCTSARAAADAGRVHGGRGGGFVTTVLQRQQFQQFCGHLFVFHPSTNLLTMRSDTTME